MSEVVQPVGFPERWRTAPLWTLFRRTSRKGHSAEPLLSVYRDFGVVPRGFTDDNWNRIPEDLSGYPLVRPGDLVLNKMKAWQGSLGVSTYRGIVSPAYFVFAPLRDDFSQSFLHYLLRSRPFIESYGRMSGGIRVDQWDLDPWAFSRLRLPLPPLTEQRAIADYLDRETTKIDTLIEKQTTMITRLRERRALVIERVTSPPDRPREQAPLQRGLLRVDQGFSPDTSAGTDDANVWVLKSGASNHGIFREDESKPIPSNTAIPRGIELRQGDLVVSRASGSPALVASAALVGHLDRRVVLSDKNFRLVPAKNASARYLYWVLNSPGVRSRIILSISGAEGLANNIPLSRLRRLLIPLPPLDEQREIADYLDRETAKIDTLIAKVERHIELARERRAALITAAVTGQIDVTTSTQSGDAA